MIGAHAYRELQTQTATPGRLLVLLLRRCKSAMAAAHGAVDPERTNQLLRAIDIVAELQRTLDHKRAPELCRSLDDVYAFVIARLLLAHGSGASTAGEAALFDAERAFGPIADAFEQLLAGGGTR